MSKVFLDSSVLIGLTFRHAAERRKCEAAIPATATRVVSRYVLFEVARGFLRSLIELHNISFEFSAFSELHQAAHSGQLRFKPYRMQTWLGAFDDYFKALEAKDGEMNPELMLQEFRAKLRGWVRRGWRCLQDSYLIVNNIGCRNDIPSPEVQAATGLLHQSLPVDECGVPNRCGVLSYFEKHHVSLNMVASGLNALPKDKLDAETLRRIAGLKRLLAARSGDEFEGHCCHHCGDALICHEAPARTAVVSKNRKHFEVLCALTGKRGLFA